MIERDAELKVWSMTPESARHFFGLPETTPARIIQDGPQTPDEIERYLPDAKLFGLTVG